MKRFWISWYSGNYADEGCTKPSFKFWVSGSRCRANYGLSGTEWNSYNNLSDEDEMEEFLNEFSRDDCTICAVIDSESKDKAWELVAKHFPDYQERFCEEKDINYKPGDRFT